MKVRDIMTTEIATAALDTTLDEIATMMRDLDTGAIPIVEDDELRGLLTDRDIVIRCIAAGKEATDTTAAEILSEDLETVEPDTDVEEASRIMARHQVRRLPVMEDGRLCGIVSLGDIAVKSREEMASGALENVSEGVKATKAPKAARQPAAQPAVAKKRAQRGRAPRGETGGTAEIARHGSGDTGSWSASPHQQEISNHSAEQEERRQARVVPIRGGKSSKNRRAS